MGCAVKENGRLEEKKKAVLTLYFPDGRWKPLCLHQ